MPSSTRPGAIRADFSRSCEGCSGARLDKGGFFYRCCAAGPRQGYAVARVVKGKGRFPPYVPAWCPLLSGRAD